MSTSVFLQCSFYCSVSTSSGLGDDVPENIVSKHWERINTNSIFLLALRVCLFFFFYYSSKQPNAAMLVVIVFGSDMIWKRVPSLQSNSSACSTFSFFKLRWIPPLLSHSIRGWQIKGESYAVAFTVLRP